MNNDLAFLLNQLDQPKFLRLFKTLGKEEKKQPLNLLNTELWYSSASSGVMMDAWSVDRIFQLAFAPASMLNNQTFFTFVEKSLTSALLEIQKQKKISKLLTREIRVEPLNSFYDITEYYFILNVDHEMMNTDHMHNLMKDIFKKEGFPIKGDQFLENPNLGWGTPSSFIKGEQSQVKKYIGDLLNTPSELYLVAREGTISVVPSTHHGLYFASSERKKTIRNTETGFAASISTECAIPGNENNARTILEFQDLLNRPKLKEQEIQVFLEQNPDLLCSLDERYTEIKPQVVLIDRESNRLIPDFIARVEDSNIWDIIELKLPTAPTLVKSRDREGISKITSQAISQLIKYNNFFTKKENRNRFFNKYGIAPYEPCLTVVIGRGSRSNHYQWSSVRMGFPDVRIVSYDFLIEKALECKKRNKKLLSDRKESLPL